MLFDGLDQFSSVVLREFRLLRHFDLFPLQHIDELLFIENHNWVDSITLDEFGEVLYVVQSENGVK